ncbi:DUF4282 domain-containing protein [Nitriliruptor alkaliphilus]|uniref:DUF4282 domain-containing protein n=1 Tax=Nitriliruptor alkaliphilus TaxID=427918 RepID=UPI000696116E|nr:DUF4282 domain-containing protein [Nitriliruptor alkaliphilus]
MSAPTSDTFEGDVFSSLVDFGFTRYATPKLIRILYIIGFVVVVLYTLGFLFTGIGQGGFFAVLALVGAPIIGLFALLYLRVTTELLSVLFRIGQNVASIADEQAGGPGPGSGGGTAPPPGPMSPPAGGGPGAPGAPGGPAPTGPPSY